MAEYRTYFKLDACVNDIGAAQEYLSEDNMTEYLTSHLERHDHSDLAKKIEEIEWRLSNESSGFISLKTNSDLDTAEISIISEWVSGQNSDGLGEGFEQQEFANYNANSLSSRGYSWDEDCDDEEDWVMASFDWKTNEYIFEKV